MVSNLFVVLKVKQNWPNLHLHRFYDAKIILNKERVLISPLHFNTYIFYDLSVTISHNVCQELLTE